MPLEVYIYVVFTCLILLATSITKICDFFLQRPILKMAATLMTVEFDTIHRYSSLEENSEARLCSALNRYKH